ncbi:hypothetical protein TNIN_308341 [Trichonephila inaurata madagascariensis]|uniref:Uncharacterized protein n=1 Tax=Trichonephila inaurata madagascariensis TaxID=2747483 RepID=A0A8X6X9F9_9ARAC|nr:hypothetical protein TNIN_308341 [Trichonephila inaurata madagascariensis]
MKTGRCPKTRGWEEFPVTSPTTSSEGMRFASQSEGIHDLSQTAWHRQRAQVLYLVDPDTTVDYYCFGFCKGDWRSDKGFPTECRVQSRGKP